MRIAYFLVVVLFLVADHASAGCFSEQVIEDDSYKAFKWTNNCDSPATVTVRRYYKKDNGAGAVDTSQFTMGPCGTFTNQYPQGKFQNDFRVDESKICIPKTAERPAGGEDNEKSGSKQVDDSRRATRKSTVLDDDLARRLENQKAKDSDAIRRQQEANFKNEVDGVKTDYLARKKREDVAAAKVDSIKPEAKARDDERTNRDIQTGRSQLCFGVTDTGIRRAGGEREAIAHSCQGVCSLVAPDNNRSYESCYAACNNPSVIGGHCAPIDPSIRNRVLSQLRRNPNISLPND